MRFEGRVFKVGRYWAVEVPILGVVTQGRTKKGALVMIADAVESLVNREGFSVEVFPTKEDYFEIGSSDQAALTALLLKRQRTLAGLSLAEVAHRLGSSSPNTYARYEHGRGVPTVPQLSRLLAAVAPQSDFVLSPARAGKVA